MLPFLKNKDPDAAAAGPVEHEMREPDDGKEYDPMHSAAQDLISAVHSKNVKAVAEALRAAFELSESEPHEEDEYV